MPDFRPRAGLGLEVEGVRASRMPAAGVGAYAQCNSLPYENTYLDLDPEVKDPLGDPVCRITSGPKENEPKRERITPPPKRKSGSAPPAPSRSS